jgi:hypothetical protein
MNAYTRSGVIAPVIINYNTRLKYVMWFTLGRFILRGKIFPPSVLIEYRAG